MKITVVQGDITTQEVDAITNAARPSCLGGGGVDGAIHKAAGPDLYEMCLDLPLLPTDRIIEATQVITDDEVRVNVGDVRATPAANLPAKWVLHAVGPVYYPMNPDCPKLLRAVYHRSLLVAQMLGCRTVAMPAISAGAYGYPMDEVAGIAIEVASLPCWYFDEVRFVLFPDDVKAAFDAALARHASTP